MLRIYEGDRFEFALKQYFDNNTALKWEGETAPISFESSLNPKISAIAYLYMIDETDFNKAKTINENLITNYSCTIVDNTIYLKEQATDLRGLFRFKIEVDSVPYYTSEIFCINDVQAESDIVRLDSEMLKAYYGDYFEFSAKQYFDNNTVLSFNQALPDFSFKWAEVVSSIVDVELYLMQIENDSLTKKILLENEIGEIASVVSTSEKVYTLGTSSQHSGIFRYKVILNPGAEQEIVYSELFCINDEISNWILETHFWDDFAEWIDTEIWND